MERFIGILDLEHFATRSVEFLPRLFVAILIMFGFWLLYRITRRSLQVLCRRASLDPILSSLLIDKIYRFVMIVFGLVMAASQVGVNVGAALAGIGVVGIAVGFAAQDLLSNVIAGLVIFWDKPFQVGDYVKIGDQYGDVADITLRTTRIRTPRNTYVIIPNKNAIDDVVVNHSKHGDTRIDVPIGIAYKENVPAAREVLLAAARTVTGVLADPQPSVVVMELGNSSVDLMLRGWIANAEDEMPIFSALLEAGKLALDAAHIQIPFPHLQLFVDDVEPRVVEKLAALPGFGGNKAVGG